MNDEQRPSLLSRILSVAFFSILTLAVLTWFIVSITELISQFRFKDPVIGFDKGSMYMLGCGLALLLLSAGGVIQGIMRVELTKKKENWFTRGIIISLILMVTFPQLTHYLVNNYADKQHYIICNDATYRWLLYKKIYYTKNKITCDKLVNEKKTTNSSGR